jgi:hypothetical protein
VKALVVVVKRDRVVAPVIVPTPDKLPIFEKNSARVILLVVFAETSTRGRTSVVAVAAPRIAGSSEILTVAIKLPPRNQK